MAEYLDRYREAIQREDCILQDLSEIVIQDTG